MPKKPKVVPLEKVVSIEEETNKVIARDPRTQRIILAIGPDRLVIDRLFRVTRLPPGRGDQPASVVPMHPEKKQRESRPKAARRAKAAVRKAVQKPDRLSRR